MKLRNKKTGEVFDLDKMPKWLKESIQLTAIFYSKECEVYEPAEPLIKDEKIRKAVRAWAEANDLDGATFYMTSHFWYLRTFNDREQGIDFWLKWEDKPDLIESKYYTIAELCGEEEE